jgi:hypothetical protein
VSRKGHEDPAPAKGAANGTGHGGPADAANGSANGSADGADPGAQAEGHAAEGHAAGAVLGAPVPVASGCNGLEADGLGADVVPFRQRLLGEPIGTRPPRRGRNAPGGGARPEPATPGGEEGEEPALERQVCALAARGLAEEEIRARLELPPRMDDGTELMLAEAFRRGQLLGRARVKEAQFEAALQGRVTAQAHVLARLGEPRGEAGEESDEEDTAVGRDFPPDAEA